MTRRFGAYVLPGDPVWLARSLEQYYPLLDDLVVPVPADGLSWTGRPLPLDHTLGIIREVDSRGIMRIVDGEWTDRDHPLRADTAQRQAAVDAMRSTADWVIQIDNDEYLPDPTVIARACDEADARGIPSVEWPMRVLYRRTRRAVYEVVTPAGMPLYEYPGPILVRPGTRLTQARRSDGEVLRMVVSGDVWSPQVMREAEAHEHLVELVEPDQAMVHNSWARAAADIRRKIASSGHSQDVSLSRYYWTRWVPAPLVWRWLKDFHPLFGSLWPRLARRPARGIYAA